MEAFKAVGGAILGITAFLGIIIVCILVVIIGAQIAFVIAPFVYWLAGLLFFLNCISLVAAIIPSTRMTVGGFLYGSSYVYGLATWIYGLAVCLTLWGWLAVIIGLLMGGIGVVPIGMLAALFNTEWQIFFALFAMVILTYASRAIGVLLMVSAEQHSIDEDRQIIDTEIAEESRTWKDLE